MSEKVILKITEGPMAGRDFPFEEHDTFLFGRNEDCQASLPDDRRVSRYHFILEVNPPDACIRDMGSMNGTFVNDAKHGGREKGETPEEGARRRHPEVNLRNGDVIRVGGTTLTVQVETSAYCCECGQEISPDMLAESLGPGGTHICPNCKEKLAAAARPAKKPEPARCKKCGRDVSREMGDRRRDNYVCVSCRNDVMGLIKHLLQQAKSGERSLVAIRGYNILKELGQGGMGAVFLAQKRDKDGEKGEPVALKVMLPKVAASPRNAARFHREVEISRALHHPHVVELREWGQSDGTYFFTLEFCEGGSVDALMRQRGGRLSVEEAGKIILDVLDGLEYAHSAEVTYTKMDGTKDTAQGVVHRDLSPQNIFLVGSGSSQLAKVADFGLGKGVDIAGLGDPTVTGQAAGKPLFIPRQQVIDFKYAKPEVDVWAAAACLYNMLTGVFPRFPPIVNEKHHKVQKPTDPWQIVLTTDAIPIRTRDPSIQEPLAEVIDYALIDSPEIPIKSVIEFKRELERVL